MKRIAYIEMDTHAEIAGNFVQLMQDSAEFEVDYYLSEKVFKLIEKPGTDSIITIPPDLLRMLKDADYDLVIIGTVHRYFNVFDRITEQFNTAVIVHNQNFSRASAFQLFTRVFQDDIAYRIKLLMTEGLLSAPRVYSNAKHLLLLNPDGVKAPYKSLPVLFNEFSDTVNLDRFCIVIPGSVSQQRRDYAGIFQKLRHFRSEVEVVFLGKAAGEELKWIVEFGKSKPGNVSIQYFTEKVDSKTFETWMRKASVLWCPLQSETTFFSQNEFYGVTKMTGNLGDAIRFGKCAVFPEDYPAKEFPFIFNERENIEELLLNASACSFNFQQAYSQKAVAYALHAALRSMI